MRNYVLVCLSLRDVEIWDRGNKVGEIHARNEKQLLHRLRKIYKIGPVNRK